MIRAVLFLFFFFFVVGPVQGAPFPGSAKTLTRTSDAVKISGMDIPPFLGANIHLLRLFAFREGHFQPIPFQVDQKDSKGEWVWDVAFRDGRTRDDQDPEGESLLDENDRLVFLAGDTGDRASFPERIKAAKVLEIEVIDPVNHGSGWTYLALFPHAPPPLSPVRYMTYDPQKRNVYSPLYSLSYSTKKIAVMDALTFRKKSILDRLKIRIKAEIKFGFIKTAMHFNEEDVRGYHVGYIAGPVRIINRTVNQVRLPLGLRTPKVVCDHYFYPRYAEIPLLLHMNFLVSRASLLLSADYRGAPFSQAFLPGLKEAVKLTGRTPLRLDPAKGDWIALDGDLGTVINAMQVPVGISRYISTRPHLISDRERSYPPESVPGSDPEAVIEIRTAPDLPKGDYLLYTVFLFSPDHFKRGDEKKLLNILNRPLTVRVGQIQ
ncbi:MAG: hypothetical protein GXP58_11370 [Deltaproteobacteria bacterium]|nr:hypothetical protein [Deltaproteobacteria bacterium]